MANRALFVIALILLVAHLCATCGINSDERNSINFQDSIQAVQDSIKQVNFYLDKMKETDVKNFFFDNEDYLYISNMKIGRMAIGDTINFLNAIEKYVGLSRDESLRFISLVVFLKDNKLSGCFKHRIFGIYMYSYMQTVENDYDDQRFIILVTEDLKGIKGNYIESYQVIDRKADVLLLATSDAKIR